MKLFAAFGVLAALLVLDSSAEAQAVDLTKMNAAELVKACRGQIGAKQYTKDANRQRCLSYLTGAFDMLTAWQKTNGASGLCLPPEGITQLQMIDAIAGWLEAHQKEKTSAAKLVVPHALMDTYGCPKLPLD